DPVSPLRYKCVNISQYAGLNNSGACNMPTEYELIPTDSGIIFHPGDYIFESKSLTSPSICIYYNQ
ncbi:MAG: hypothetical protein COT55_00750, partial [Candidatus Diapherotrites archaeon CG09_land_8_20_14_0_10_32_12]